ncbi:MAG: hypothetical protein CM15mP120_12300 [Pseudomonadota bacterium]|nr:MAG: hypothetical protein CM15mP120_12300 [Pseudomonadota bacterium]
MVVEPASLKVTGIDLDDPHRDAQDEASVLKEFFSLVRAEMKLQGCHRAILVAHNASFDQGFLNTACDRQKIKRNPFHPFTTLDTATLGALAYGHTVLREACRRANIDFSEAVRTARIRRRQNSRAVLSHREHLGFSDRMVGLSEPRGLLKAPCFVWAFYSSDVSYLARRLGQQRFQLSRLEHFGDDIATAY